MLYVNAWADPGVGQEADPVPFGKSTVINKNVVSTPLTELSGSTHVNKP